ncbi:MAG: HNH endonuclease [Solirubrobacteraceae bacterium]
MRSRRFGSSARVALFLAAHGRCAVCGVALQPGWHADHVRPISAGGETESGNGQALCPRCNLRKGPREQEGPGS